LQTDIDDGAVSVSAAERLYGVVVVDRVIDSVATEKRRAASRSERLGWPAATDRPAIELPDGALRRGPMGSEMVIVEAPDGRAFTICRCGHPLSSVSDPWRAHARQRTSTDVNQFSRSTRLNPVLELREYACPSCGTLLATDVARVGSAILHDIQMED
jgi:N-methylhydantoinase B